MTGIDWTPLRQTLAALRETGIEVPFWWRDDDATQMTDALTRLAKTADQVGVPVHLAIIPAQVSADFPAACVNLPVLPVVHGWAHADHSKPGEKKNEFQTPRPAAIDETAKAFAHMQFVFGSDVRRMFVPPWNRIAPDVVHALPKQGYRVISTFGPRRAQEAAPGLAQVNTHVDPICWRGNRDLIDPDELIQRACAHLNARRCGNEDATEPFGLLTHHLVHTPAVWTFAEQFAQEMLNGGSVPWVMENHT